MQFRPVLVLISVFLGGCLAIPHLKQRSPRVSGVVVDLTTLQPISDARVEFAENPALAVITDAKGAFSIPPSYKPELFVPIGDRPNSLDLFARIEPELRISKEGYDTRQIDGRDLRSLDSDRYGTSPIPTPQNDVEVFLKTIFLTRQSEGPNKAPEPTPGAVTPRATEGTSK